MMRRLCSVLAFTTAMTIAGTAFSQKPPQPDAVRMTWFGITNWYYEIGDTGILIDGVVSKYDEKDAKSDEGLVERVYKALDRGAGVDSIFIGHEHSDHSFDAVSWAKVTGSKIYTSEVACTAAIAKGLPKDQCHPVYGGEVVKVGDNTEVRVVRWLHSMGCDDTSEGGTKGIETFGFLLTANTSSGKLSWFMSDSGAGGQELVTNRLVNSKDFGSPLGNLTKAVRDAGLSGFDLWQGGPESRVVNQARTLLPVFNIKYFMPQHYGARGGYNILSGLHYAYKSEEQPKLAKVLEEYGVKSLISQNYFDSYSYSAQGVASVSSDKAKSAMGLPMSGPGPKPQETNPRAGKLECEAD